MPQVRYELRTQRQGGPSQTRMKWHLNKASVALQGERRLLCRAVAQRRVELNIQLQKSLDMAPAQLALQAAGSLFLRAAQDRVQPTTRRNITSSTSCRLN